MRSGVGQRMRWIRVDNRASVGGDRLWSVAWTARIVAVLAFLAVLTSCGQISDSASGGNSGVASTEVASPEANPRTVEEYAQLCTGQRLTDYETVYEMVDAVKESLEKYRKIEPPDQVEEWHRVRLKIWEEIIKAAKFVPGNRRMSDYAFDDIGASRASVLIRVAEEGNAALYDLEPEVRKTLQRHECID